MDATMRLALLVAIFIGCVNAACPPDFIASITIPGKCYYLTTARRNFFSAINYCRNLTYGADILSIANESENREVESLLEPQGIPYACIGNAFYDYESHWITTAAGTSNYSNWESDADNGDVAVITPSGSWSPKSGFYFNAIICQIYPDDPTTFPPPQITCPAGWTPSISVRGKCYRNIGWNNFFSATRRCLTTRIGDSHAELVTLTSQLEMMELSVMIPYGRLAWASLANWEADGHWRWVETLHPTDYFGPNGRLWRWSDSEGTCACLDKDSDLYTLPCWDSMPTLCQYFPDEPPAPPLPGLVCPQNGTASLTKPGTCYYVLNQRQSFQSARSACQALDTGLNHNDLFVPRTAAEYEEFDTIVRTGTWYLPVWFGLTNSNGNWSWVSGRSSNISDMWCDGQPDTPQNSNDQCGFVMVSSRYDSICWTRGDCTYPFTAVCQSTNAF